MARINPKTTKSSFSKIESLRDALKNITDLSKFPSENPYPVLRIAKDGTVLYANQASYEIKKKLFNQQTMMAVPAIMKHIAKTMEGSAVQRIELTEQHNTFLFSLVPLPDAGYTNLYGLDITELKKAQKTIADLSKFPSENPYPVLRVAEDGTVLYANKACDEIKQRLFDQQTMIAVPALKKHITRGMKSNSIQEIEITKQHNTFLFSLVPVQKSRYVNLYGMKINRLKRIQSKLKKAKDIQTRFTFIASHEIRNPLALIYNYLMLLNQEIHGPLNERQKKTIDLLMNQSERLNRLCNDLLDFQKLVSGKIPISVAPHDINVIIKEIHVTMKVLFDKKNLYFTLDLAENLPTVLIDKDRIIQVIINLINNAFDMIEKGGIHITSTRKNNAVVVAVSDTGLGIKKEDMDKLFKPFRHIRKPDKKKNRKSVGLGLSICKEIIEEHGGSIMVESTYGKGSSFSFRLPLR